MQKIEGKINEKGKGKARILQNRLHIPLLVVLVVTAVIFVAFFIDLLMNSDFSLLNTVIPLTTISSGVCFEFTTILLEFTAINFSIQICSLLQQINDEFEDMNFIFDEVRLKECFKEVSELHNGVQADIAEFLGIFEYVIKVILIIDIWMMALAAIFVVDSMWVELAANIPFLLFETWIHCYAFQRIATEVWKFLNNFFKEISNWRKLNLPSSSKSLTFFFFFFISSISLFIEIDVFRQFLSFFFV